MAAEPSPSVVIDDRGFDALVAGIAAGHRTVAPVIRDGSIVLSEIRSSADLPSGVTLEQAPGRCRVVPLSAGDRRRFAWAVGPSSAKAHQHPPSRTLFAAQVTADGFTVTEPAGAVGAGDPGSGSSERPLALIGLRPCDVAAIGVLDRVLSTDGTHGTDGTWGAATPGTGPLVVVVNCAEPGGTCFCVSMGTGPTLGADGVDDADLVLIERAIDGGVEYLVTCTSERAERLLTDLDLQPDSAGPAAGAVRPATDSDVRWATATTADAAARMGRTLDTVGLAEGLTATLTSARWDEVAARCLSCGNCTMVCPTCFCSSVGDESSLDGSVVSRTQRWDSCFTLDHSFIHGGSIRSGTADRYRQWMTHKLSTWWAQFGESGCVGCGRCISWCPVGIDLVEEANGLLEEARTGEVPTAPAPQRLSVTDVLVRRRADALSSARHGEDT